MNRTALILLVVIGVVGLGIRALGERATQAPERAVRYHVPLYPLASSRSLHSMRLVAAPEIDGNLGDWPAGEGIGLDRQTAFLFSGQIDSPADLSAEIRSGWDEGTLYFAIQVNDDIIVTDSDEVWRDDGVEVGLDGLNDKAAWGSDDHQYTIVADGFAADRGEPIAEVATAVQIQDGSYSIEVAIPMSELIPGVPISGTVMGFTIGLHDDDDGGNWDAYLIWEGTNTSSAPEEFGSLIFTERLEDRIGALEAKITKLEQQIQELLTILSEFEELPSP